MLAWKAKDATDPRVKALIEEQTTAGFRSPPGFVLAGRVASKTPSGMSRALLPDGREIEVSTSTDTEITDVLGVFLTGISPQAAPQDTHWEIELPNKTKLDLKVVKADQEPGWPHSGPRSRDWSFALFTLAAAIVLYVVPRSVGWIVKGFVAPNPSR